MSNEVFVVFRDPYRTTQFHSAHSTPEDAEAMRKALTNPADNRPWEVRNLSLDTEKPTLAPHEDMEAYKVDFNANGQNVGATNVNDYEEYRKYAQENKVFPNRDFTTVYVWALDFSDSIKVATLVLFPDTSESELEELIETAQEGTAQ